MCHMILRQQSHGASLPYLRTHLEVLRDSRLRDMLIYSKIAQPAKSSSSKLLYTALNFRDLAEEDLQLLLLIL